MAVSRSGLFIALLMCHLLGNVVCQLKDFSAATVTPSSKIVFASPWSTSITRQMAVVGHALQQRGHTVSFLAHEKDCTSIAQQGLECHALPRDAGAISCIEEAVRGWSSTDTVGGRKWWTSSVHLARALDAVGLFYEASYNFTGTLFNRTGVPDIIIAEPLFGVPVVDYAYANHVPLVMFYAFPLGHAFGYEDCAACPSSGILGSYRQEHLGNFAMRMQKFLGFFDIIFKTIGPTTKFNQLRQKLGVPQYNDPKTPFANSLALQTWSLGVDVSRRLSPLTQVIGFAAEPFKEMQSREQWAPEDTDLWDWLSEQQGVVYIAFGSEVFIRPEELLKILEGVDSFSKQSGLSVLLALRPTARQHMGEEAIAQIPQSVKVAAWVRQDMVLAHNSTKLFITHGGQQSIAEGIMGLTPLLAVPFFADQPNNAIRVEEAGIGLWIDHHNFTAQEVAGKLHRLHSEPSFQQQIRRQFAMATMHGGAGRKGADAVEHVLAFGTAHLVPAEDKAPLWLSMGLDVGAVVGLTMCLILFLVYRICRFIVRRTCGKAKGGAKSVHPKTE